MKKPERIKAASDFTISCSLDVRWTEVSLDLIADLPIVESQVILEATAGDGSCFRSRNGGETWFPYGKTTN